LKSVFTKALKEKTKILLDQKKTKQRTYRNVTERSEIYHLGGGCVIKTTHNQHEHSCDTRGKASSFKEV